MNWIRIWLPLFLLSLSMACSVANPTDPPPGSVSVDLTPVATLSTPIPTATPSDEEILSTVPRCDGMQVIRHRIQFDWPNFEDRIQKFTGSTWMYYACEQPQTEVSALYRGQLPKPPFNLKEVNWFEIEEGTLGVYFSQKGSWHYVWIVPQPEDAQSAYIVMAENFAYVECFE